MGAFRSIKPWAPPRWLLAGLMIVASLCVAEEGSLATKPSSATTAPIYLPHYDEEAWSLVRGSIVDKVRREPAPPWFSLSVAADMVCL
jgi:hypothetical protein